MTRPDPARAPDDLFERIATLLEPGQREYFYQRMLYFRQLRPDDELLRIAEAIGFLALIIRDAPHAVAIAREHPDQLLAMHRASVEATANAARAHQQQLDDRLTRLPADIAAGISPPAIAQAINESLRQAFVRSGLPAMADALALMSSSCTEPRWIFNAPPASSLTGTAEPSTRRRGRSSSWIAA